MTAHKQQMYGPSRAGRARGECSIHAPVAVYDAQGGRHVPFVGSAKSMRAGTARCLTSLNWLGAVATKPSLFPIHVTLRFLPVERLRQRAGVNPLRYRLSAAFIPLRVLGRSYQSRLVQHVTRQCPDAHEGHTRTSFQSRCSDNQEHEVKGLAVGQAIFGEKQNAFG
jgi:hypothetical protein